MLRLMKVALIYSTMEIGALPGLTFFWASWPGIRLQERDSPWHCPSRCSRQIAKSVDSQPAVGQPIALAAWSPPTVRRTSHFASHSSPSTYPGYPCRCSLQWTKYLLHIVVQHIIHDFTYFVTVPWFHDLHLWYHVVNMVLCHQEQARSS